MEVDARRRQGVHVFARSGRWHVLDELGGCCAILHGRHGMSHAERLVRLPSPVPARADPACRWRQPGPRRLRGVPLATSADLVPSDGEPHPGCIPHDQRRRNAAACSPSALFGRTGPAFQGDRCRWPPPQQRNRRGSRSRRGVFSIQRRRRCGVPRRAVFHGRL